MDLGYIVTALSKWDMAEGYLFCSNFSLNIWAGNDSVFCDHYRIDIKATSEKQIKILDKTDYFHENITHPKLIKQLWVEKHGERRIIQASVKMTGVTLKAIINNE